MLFKQPNQKSVKYRTIRVREEVAQQLDEWRDIFDDASISEVLWRVLSLARRELKSIRERKKKIREQFVNDRKKSEKVIEIVDGDSV